MNLLKLSLLLFSIIFGFSSAFAEERQQSDMQNIDYDLANHRSRTEALDNITCKECLIVRDPVDRIREVFDDSRFQRLTESQRTRIPLRPQEAMIMGHNYKQALLISRDDYHNSPCNKYHDQGDFANRWCHSYISQAAASVLQEHGASQFVATLAGGLFWLPKEFLYDLNPSAHDMTLTYRDSLGTERSTFEVTVFGDAIADNHVEKFKLFDGSTPFIVWKRKLGPR